MHLDRANPYGICLIDKEHVKKETGKLYKKQPNEKGSEPPRVSTLTPFVTTLQSMFICRKKKTLGLDRSYQLYVHVQAAFGHCVAIFVSQIQSNWLENSQRLGARLEIIVQKNARGFCKIKGN